MRKHILSKYMSLTSIVYHPKERHIWTSLHVQEIWERATTNVVPLGFRKTGMEFQISEFVLNACKVLSWKLHVDALNM